MEDEDFDAELADEIARDEADRLRKAEPPPTLESGEFLAWRSPRWGDGNPTRLSHPLWHWLVRTRWSAYEANKMFGGPSPVTAGPMWCFDRMGMSETSLDDGRTVCIGGEHEDFYVPDFCIYNDVVVTHPDGRIDIHGYDLKVFQPTDFHSATQVGDSIIVIGSLGYSAHRASGTTPVFRLALDTMAISRIDTTGAAPGWIHDHDAALDTALGAIVVRGGNIWREGCREFDKNLDTWALDVGCFRWTRLSPPG